MENVSNRSAEIETPPIEYVYFARELNDIAGELLHIATRETVDGRRAKVAYGLSFQAAELAAKGMLRALGQTTSQIRAAHRNHDLIKLLDDVEARINTHEDFEKVRKFTRHTPVIDGQLYGTTIRGYLEGHFKRGPGALPRDYFYVDSPKWTGPLPPHALHCMVTDILNISETVVTTLERNAP